MQVSKNFVDSPSGRGSDCNNPLATLTLIMTGKLVTCQIARHFNRTETSQIAGSEPTDPGEITACAVKVLQGL